MDPLSKWLTTFYIYLSLFVTPSMTPGFPCFYDRITRRVIAYLVYEMHLSYVAMPLFIITYIIGFRKLSVSTIPKSRNNRVIYPGLRFTVDCHIQFPVVLSGIMLTHEYIQLLKNCRKIYNMNALLNWIPYELYCTYSSYSY